MEWITNHWQDCLAIVGGLYGVLVAITALTPTPKDDAVVGKFWAFWSKAVSFFGIDPKTGLKQK